MTNATNLIHGLPDVDPHPEFQDIPGLPGCYIDSSEYEKFGEEMTVFQIGLLYLSL